MLQKSLKFGNLDEIKNLQEKIYFIKTDSRRNRKSKQVINIKEIELMVLKKSIHSNWSQMVS